MTPPPSPTAPTAARRRPDSLTLLIAAIAVLGVALVLARQATYGPGLHHDSIIYISVARNLLAGEGFLWYDETIYTRWPPLYPLLLAAATLGIFDPLDVAGPLNAVIFGITIFVVGQYLRRRLLSRYLAIWASVMIALSIPLAWWSSWVFAGATFILMTTLALILTDKFLAGGKTSDLIWAAVFCALAWQTRYIGIAVPVVAMLFILGQRWTPFLQRAKQAAGFSLIVSVPMSLWLLRNYLLTGNFTGPQRLDGDPLPTIIRDIGNGFMGWLNYDIPFGILPLSALMLIAVAMLIPAGYILIGKNYEKRFRFDWQPFCIFGGFALTYFLFLVATTVIVIGIHSRYLTPFYIPLLLAIVFALDWILVQDKNGKLMGRIGNYPKLQHLYRKINPPGLLTCILTASLLLWAAWQILPNIKEIIQANSGSRHSAHNFSLSIPPWADSETLEYIQKNPLSGAVYSNAKHIVYLHNAGNANFRPAPLAVRGVQRGIGAGQEQLDAWIAETPNGAYLVWFKRYPKNQVYDYGTANISITRGLEPVAEFKDGIIVKVNKNYPPATNLYRSSYDAIISGEFGKPAAQSVFDLYQAGNTLAYLKQPCAADDTAARFFLHIYPADANALPAHRKQYRFDNLDFTFPEHGVMLDNKCLAIVSLPDYEIASIQTGQWIPGQRQIWKAEFTPAVPAATPPP